MAFTLKLCDINLIFSHLCHFLKIWAPKKYYVFYDLIIQPLNFFSKPKPQNQEILHVRIGAYHSLSICTLISRSTSLDSYSKPQAMDDDAPLASEITTRHSVFLYSPSLSLSPLLISLRLVYQLT